MEFSQIFLVVTGWVLLSVPASLLIGACMGRPERRAERRLAKVHPFHSAA